MEIANRTLRLPPQSADLPTRVFPPLNDIDSGIASSKISHQEVVGKLVIYSPDLLDVAPLRPSSSTASSFHPFFSISLYLSPSLSLSFSPPWKESMLKQLQKFGSEIVTEFDMVFPETNYWHHRKEFHFDWIWIDWLDMNDKRFWGASMTGHFLGIWTPKYH